LTEKFYRPGLVFQSPFSMYQYIVRPSVKNYGPDGITPIGEIRELLAEFGVSRGEFSYTDADGNTQTGVDIAGHYFDLDSQAEQKGWTAQEKEYVANRLIRACSQFPGEVSLHTKAAAARPWPKYDEADAKSIATFADQLGLVAEALVYEQENANRKAVVSDLESLLVSVQEETELAAV
jgi:hypothetical protein